MRILLTGGTGLVGNALGRRLARSHQLLVLSRDGKNARTRLSYPCDLASWDGRSELSVRALEGVEGVIHLAGENVAEQRWTGERKRALRDSRVVPLEQLHKSLQASGRQLKVLISASGVGYYGHRENEELTEDSSPGGDFLAQLCQEWEAAAKALPARRTVILRLGVVFSPEGGFLREVLRMFRRFGAGRLGSGGQFVPWIHIDDVVEVIAQSLSNPALSGPLNLVAPQTLTNAELTRKLAALCGCRRIPPAPSLVLKMMFGEMSHLMLSSALVKPKLLEALRWNFKFSDVDRALTSCVKGK